MDKSRIVFVRWFDEIVCMALRYYLRYYEKYEIMKIRRVPRHINFWIHGVLLCRIMVFKDEKISSEFIYLFFLLYLIAYVLFVHNRLDDYSIYSHIMSTLWFRDELFIRKSEQNYIQTWQSVLIASAPIQSNYFLHSVKLSYSSSLAFIILLFSIISNS